MAPRRSVRLRLTLLYGALFLVAGGLLLAVTYLLAVHGPLPGQPDDPEVPTIDVLGGEVPVPDISQPDEPSLADELADQRDADRRRLLVGSGAALALMGIVSVGLGWYVAGRILRPLASMTATTRRISADNLAQRLDATGPDDELKELSDTIDQLLDRLATAFESQRRFVANASHELRTPLTLQRTSVEVALADPEVSADELRRTCIQVLRSTEHQERLIETLLVLARSQRGLDKREEVDLADIVDRVLDERRVPITARSLRVETSLDRAPVSGDRELLGRLVENLVDNALRHNVPAGWIDVSTSEGRLVVANSGPPVPAERIDSLTQPFRRLEFDRTGGGTGIGLSIVDAVVTAHAGRLSLSPGAEGGLQVQVDLPPPRN